MKLLCQFLLLLLLLISSSFAPLVFAAPEVPTEDERRALSALIQERQRQFPRRFRNFTLENGLEVLLIKDPRAKSVGVSMNVSAGFWMDPPQLRGLAHYLEHMLFLGTVKYPKASEYHEFMEQNGGEDNAYTTVDHTNYHFTIQDKFLEEALDRFGHFFIDPTFPAEFVLKELDAVDAEFKKDELRFANRVDYLEGILSNPAHRNARVFQGSQKSLAYVGEKKLREALIEFHRKHYTADQMKLVIVGPMNLKSLEPIIRSLFSQVPRTSTPFMPKPLPKPLMNDRALPELVEVKPAGSERKLILRFEIPSWYDFMYTSPHSLLSDLLTRTEAGTLLSLLRDHGWVTDLRAEGTDLDGRNIFKLEFQLTESGRENWKEVCSLFFQTVAFLKSKDLPFSFFEAAQKKSELDFGYSAPRTGQKMAIRYASRMPFLHWTAVELMEDLLIRYNPKALQPLLVAFRPEKMQVFLTEPHLEKGPLGMNPGVKEDATYPFLYRATRIAGADIKRWSDVGPAAELRLPEANPFVPKSRSLVGTQDLEPRVLVDDEFQKLWIQTDHQFKKPSASIRFQISAVRPETSRDFALMEVLLSALERSHEKWNGPATQVGYVGTLSRNRTGFGLGISGYTDRFLEFSDAFVSRMLTVNLTPAEFENVRAEILQSIDRIDVLDPYLVANSGRAEVLHPERYPQRELRDFITKITLGEVQTAAGSLLTSVWLKGVAFGNITPEMALHVSGAVLKLTRGSPLRLQDRPVFSLVALEPGPGIFYQSRVNGKNQGWLSFFEFKGLSSQEKLDPSLQADLELGESILSSWFFDELRTKRSIGYIVFANSLIEQVVGGFNFLIQSDWSLQKIQSTAEEFIRGAAPKIRSLGVDQFRAIQDSYVKTLEKRALVKTFGQKEMGVQESVFEHAEDFHWQSSLIQAATTSTQERVANLFEQNLSERGQRRLNFYVQGKDGEGVGVFPSFGGRQIADLEVFKHNAPRHFLKR